MVGCNGGLMVDEWLTSGDLVVDLVVDRMV